MINAYQIKIIHTLKNNLELSNDEYQSILSGYNVTTSKDLDYITAQSLISKLEAAGVAKGVWNKRKPKIMKRFENLKERTGMATPAQLRMLESMWCTVSVQKTLKEKQDAFNKFLNNRFGIARIEWLESNMVAKVKRTLKSMSNQERD